jgi:asparagine synthase (glutamine-hydrolysing)
MTGFFGWFGGSFAANSHARALERLAAAGPYTSLIQESDVGLFAVTAHTSCARSGDLIAAAQIAGGRPSTPPGSLFAERCIEKYRAGGAASLTTVAGPFTLVVFDLRERRALFAIDRCGIGSLAYAEVRGGTVFGTDAATVAWHDAVGRKLNPQAIHDFAFLHTCPAPRTIYRGVAKLEPAQALVVSPGKPSSVSHYWTPAFCADGPADETRLAAELRDTLQAAVVRAANGAKVGSFLSGGLDSSTVTGFAASAGPQYAHAYTIGFQHPDYDESHFARIAAERFRADLKLYYVTPDDVASSIRDIARAYDEPFGNSSAVPTLFCARNAVADGVRIMLAGDGGDELFAGNERYAKQALFRHYERVPRFLRAALIDPVAYKLGRASGSGPLWKLYRYVDQARAGTGRRMLEVFDQRKGIPPSELFTAEFGALLDPRLPGEEIVDFFARSPATNDIDRMLHLDWKITLADNDLRKVNRMCEFAGAEVRYPMLDDTMLDLCTRVPASLKLRDGQLRYFYKRAFAEFLPTEIINKRKHGFGLPFGEWLRSEPVLRDLTYPTLQALKQRGIFSAAAIDRVVAQHGSEHASYYGSMVWALLMLELWLQEHSLTT